MSFSPPGTITGSGTINTICKFTAGTVIGDSLITDDGTIVTANTANLFWSSSHSGGLHGFMLSTGTLPSVTTANVLGASFSFTSAGNSANSQIGLQALLLQGYTGTSGTAAIYANNLVAGTQNSINIAAGGAVSNTCVFGDYDRNNATYGIALYGRADQGTGARIGVVGRANEGAACTLNVGGVFLGRRGTKFLGAYVGLDVSGTDPTFTSSALLVNNAAETVPIAIFQDNGTAKVTINDGGSVTFASGTRYPIVSKAVDYTATTDDFTILVDASIANTTITLPVAATCAGQVLNVKKTDATANTVILDADAAETIDGALTQTISARWDSYMVQSDGVSAWFII